MTRSPRASADQATLLAYFIVITLGGMSPVLVRVTLRELEPLWGGFLRFSAAAVLLGAIVVIRRLPLPRGRALLGVVLFGTLGVGLSTALIYRGLVETPAGVSQVILALVPLVTFLFAVAHRIEPFRWNALIGALIAVGGVAVVFSDQLSSNVPIAGMLSILAASVTIAETTVLLKWFPSGNPFSSNAIALPLAAAGFFVASTLFGEPRGLPRSPEVWFAFAWLTVLGTLGVMTLFLVIIKRLSVSIVSYQFLLMPLVTVAASAVITGERISPAFLLGAAIVLFGVYIGIVRPARAPQPQIVPVPPLE